MASDSLHLATPIDRPADEVYRFASDPVNLPQWAAGLSSSIRRVADRWVADSPMGTVTVALAEPSDYGVLDHYVTLPTGETFYNPVRVIAAGAGCEVVFTLRRAAGTSDQDFARDADAVRADLATLKRILEAS